MLDFKLDTLPNQNGKIALITGANDGLGKQTTMAFVSKGIHVVMACRNLEKAEQVKKEILGINPKANLDILPLDLSKLSNVREFAKVFNSKYNQLDYLINNAGIMIPPFELTEDGFESQMGVNYFSHFLLTSLMMENLLKTPNSRVVSMSSIAHKSGKIDFEDLNSQKNYNKFDAYSQSKLACLMFAYELDKRLKKHQANTSSIAAHPGVSATNLFQYMPSILKVIAPLFTPFIAHSPDKAALPEIAAALSSEVNGGDYIGPDGFREMKGKPMKANSNKISKDEEVAKKLWEVSEKMCDTKFEF